MSKKNFYKICECPMCVCERSEYISNEVVKKILREAAEMERLRLLKCTNEY